MCLDGLLRCFLIRVRKVFSFGFGRSFLIWLQKAFLMCFSSGFGRSFFFTGFGPSFNVFFDLGSEGLLIWVFHFYILNYYYFIFFALGSDRFLMSFLIWVRKVF